MTCSPIRPVRCPPQPMGTALPCWDRPAKEGRMEPIQRRLVFWFACGVFLLATTTAWAQGFVGPPAPLDPSLGFIDTYRQLRGIWFFDLFPAAQDLFWTLATLELVLSCILWMAAWFHIDTLAQHLFKKILFISVGYAILLHADTWIPDIIASF